MMALSASLTLCIQVIYLCIYYVRAQYPTMYNMPGLQGMQPMPQVFSYPTQLQGPEYYEPAHHKHNHHSKHKHTKKTHKSKRKEMRANHEVSNSQESSENFNHKESHSASKSSEECDFNSCQQCTVPFRQCQAFCEGCLMNQMPINQEILLVPYPYPYLVNMQPSDQNPQSTETKPKDDNSKDEDRKTTEPNTSYKTTEPNTGHTTTEHNMTEPTEPTESPSKKLRMRPTEKPSEKLTLKPTENLSEKTTLKLEDKDKVKLAKIVLQISKNKIENQNETTVLLNDSLSDLTDTSKPFLRNNYKWIKKENGKANYLLNSPRVVRTKNPIQILLDTEKDHAQGKNFNDIIFKLPDQDTNYVISSLRRVKQDWTPKYGIVPIPESMASQLMLHLRATKLLKPDRETMAIRGHKRGLLETPLTDAEDKLRQADLPTELVNKIYRY